MRLNGSQCSPVKETAGTRILRNKKVCSSADCQEAVLSDISNLRCPGRTKKKELCVRAGRSGRKSLASPKHSEDEMCETEAVSKSRHINVACQPLSCTTIGRKRVVGVDGNCGPILQICDATQRPALCNRSPAVYLSSPEFDTSPRKRFSPSPPSTPAADKSLRVGVTADEGVENLPDSLLEGLPFDVLVRIVCCLQHHELKPVFQVCGRLRSVVTFARQFHFNFTTPDRSKKERLGPLNFQHAENLQCGRNVASEKFTCPTTPNAPKQPQNSSRGRISDLDLQPFAPPLFQESDVVFPNSRDFFRKSRPTARDLPSHRVLFYEDELCQAVAQNTI